VQVNFKPIYIPPPVDQNLGTPSPDIPVPPKDQYIVSLNLDQTLYDGGLTSKQKKVEMASLEIDRQNVEIELYKLKGQINRVYFGIAILQENEKMLRLLKEDMGTKLKDLETAIKYGTVLESEGDVLRAEMIKIDQQITEVEISKMASFSMLEELLSVEIDPETRLLLPSPQNQFDSFENKRLEYQLFSLQQYRIEESKKLVSAQWMPQVMGYGQLGYGNPGLNMINDKFDSFYIFGARLQWKLWNWNKYKKENQVLELQSQILDNQKETFDKNIRVAVEQDMAEIRKYEALIIKDHEIIKLREKIAKTASTQLDNGVITSTDYVTRVNDAAQSKINLETHKIRLTQAKINYLNTLGKL
jgi:outer membrane protein TolC